MADSFHFATFALLGRPLLRSAEAELAVAETERRIGVTLPDSVREWLGYGGAVEILAKYSNDDPPIPVSDFAIIEWNSKRLIPFRNENQGVCTWAILLDGSEDPPVYVDVDSDGREWDVCASTFSGYVRGCVWDHKIVLQRTALAQGQGEPLSPRAVQQLEEMFQAEAGTHGGRGSTNYRFQGDGFAILIWSSENEADWFVSGENEAALEEGLRAISRIDEVPVEFYRPDSATGMR